MELLDQRVLPSIALLFTRTKGLFSTRRLHNGLHTYRTFAEGQVDLNEKARSCRAFAEPSSGLEPETPSLPCDPNRNRWQPLATVRG
jgi:hypothetical protein